MDVRAHHKAIMRQITIIKEFCESRRGENIMRWANETAEGDHNHPPSDEEESKKRIKFFETVFERVERGEYITTYSTVSPDGVINATFDPLATGYTINSSKRPERLSTWSFLHPQIFKDQLQEKPFPWSAFDDAIGTIALDFFSALHRDHLELKAVAEDWKRRVEAVQKKESHFWHQVNDHRKLSDERRLLRYNIILTAEKVRNGERLPDPKDLFGKHPLPPIRNVDSTDPCFVHNDSNLESIAHSLVARIGLRHAARIGYLGPRSSQGGMRFS